MKWKRLTKESSERNELIDERNKLEREIESKGGGLLKALYTIKQACSPVSGDSELLEKCTRWLELENMLARGEIRSMYSGRGGNWTGD